MLGKLLRSLSLQRNDDGSDCGRALGFRRTFGAFMMDYRRGKALSSALDGDRAFDEIIRVQPYEKRQLRRLRPLVEHVGVVRVPAPIHANERYAPAREMHQVFVLDTLGEVHDVYDADGDAEAMGIVRHLAEELDAEIIAR